jgi:6-phosphofructokinase 2
VDVLTVSRGIAPTRKVRTFDESFEPGGGGVNVARVIGELGGDAELLYLAGGMTAAMLECLMDREQLPRRLIKIDGNTRISFTVRVLDTDLEYRFVTEGPKVSRAELDRCIDAIRRYDYATLVASGSLPPGTPPDFLVEIAKVAAAKGARFVLDSSGPGLRTTLAQAHSYLVKPSIEELEELAGEKLDEDGARRVATDIVKSGAAEIVAVTLGAGGALVATRDRVLRRPAINVEVRSAVGAGDSFLGAMTLALSQGRELEDALLLALAAGAAALAKPDHKLCSRDTVLELYERERAGQAAS